MPKETNLYATILTALLKVSKENIELKKQIETMKIQRVSSTVSNRIDEWLNQPYNGSSERQDIEKFSEEITKYIHYELKN